MLLMDVAHCLSFPFDTNNLKKSHDSGRECVVDVGGANSESEVAGNARRVSGGVCQHRILIGK